VLFQSGVLLHKSIELLRTAFAVLLEVCAFSFQLLNTLAQQDQATSFGGASRGSERVGSKRHTLKKSCNRLDNT
jgi:hypothetical protein